MKIAVIAVFFASSVFAQAQVARIASACGPDSVNFKVKLDDTQHMLEQPELGSARVYFIQDKGPQSFGIGGSVQSRIGLDGRWVGANRNNSWFSVSVGPGEHHVCEEAEFPLEERMELAHFTVKAGKVYYFRTRAVLTSAGLYLTLGASDSDEAEYLIASYPLSVSQLKK